MHVNLAQVHFRGIGRFNGPDPLVALRKIACAIVLVVVALLPLPPTAAAVSSSWYHPHHPILPTVPITRVPPFPPTTWELPARSRLCACAEGGRGCSYRCETPHDLGANSGGIPIPNHSALTPEVRSPGARVPPRHSGWLPPLPQVISRILSASPPPCRSRLRPMVPSPRTPSVRVRTCFPFWVLSINPHLEVTVAQSTRRLHPPTRFTPVTRVV